jgi:hypothetical protein
MYNYSFRPTFPLFHRSAQLLLASGITSGLFAAWSLISERGQLYANLPLIVFSLVCLSSFIIQYIRFIERTERGYFFVVDLEGFHSYAGRNNDVQMKWKHIQSLDRDGYNLLVLDKSGVTHTIYIGHYQRIDRLRIECLMHQFLMHHKEMEKQFVSSDEPVLA